MYSWYEFFFCHPVNQKYLYIMNEPLQKLLIMYFGLKNEESNHEPLVLGFKLQQIINTLAVFLQDIGKDLKTAKDSNNADLGEVQRAGERLIYLSNQIDKLTQTLLSEKTFTL